MFRVRAATAALKLASTKATNNCIARNAFKGVRSASFVANKVRTAPLAPRQMLGFNIRQFSAQVEVAPPLGDSISSCVVKDWMVKPGDAVAIDDVIVVVETDKVTVDIRAKNSGVFLCGVGEEGTEVLIGEELYQIDPAATAAATTTESAAAPAVEEAAEAVATNPGVPTVEVVPL